jgi:membrane-associated protein
MYEEITNQILALTGSLNIWLVIAILVLFAVSEFGLSIPYLMETMWILVGFHARHDLVFGVEIPLLMLVSVCARCTGAAILYHFVGLGRGWLLKVYRRFFSFALSAEAANNGSSLPARVLRRMNLSSPFIVALGRMIWLKIPITLTMSVRKELKPLLKGAAIYSLIWDSIYILIGVMVGSAELKTWQTVLYSVGALVVVYSLVFLARRLLFRGLGKEKAPCPDHTRE